MAALFGLTAAACEVEVDEDQDGDGVVGWADCDDRDATVGAPTAELCNGIDDDCDGSTDEDALGAELFYADSDGDGFGDPNVGELRCGGAVGWSRSAGDCDDRDASIAPGAEERCNGIDDDCDYAVDEDAVDARTWYEDVDRDGFGGETTTVACEQPCWHTLSNTAKKQRCRGVSGRRRALGAAGATP